MENDSANLIDLRDDGQIKCERFPVELTESGQEGKVYTALVSGHMSCSMIEVALVAHMFN